MVQLREVEVHELKPKVQPKVTTKDLMFEDNVKLGWQMTREHL